MLWTAPETKLQIAKIKMDHFCTQLDKSQSDLSPDLHGKWWVVINDKFQPIIKDCSNEGNDDDKEYN